MAKINLAQQLATTLEQAGIKRIWGLTGDSLNGLTDALRTMDSIEWMHVRHEEVAAFAAGAEAAATGELSVCAGSCGPTRPGAVPCCTRPSRRRRTGLARVRSG